MNSHQRKLYHFGAQPLCRSTLSDANNKRDYRIYKDLFFSILERVQQIAPKYKLKLSRKLYIMDSTTIDLCLKLFPWARFRKTNSAIRIHTLMQADGSLPAFLHVTDGKVHDESAARSFHVPPGSFLAIDRGYTDYKQYKHYTNNNIRFVTRLKQNADTKVIKTLSYSSNRVFSDEIVIFTGLNAASDYPFPIRKIRYYDPDNDKELIFLSNDLKLDAQTIADIYKARWEIGVSRQGHIIQSVKVRPGLKDSIPVAWEAPWREIKMVKPSDKRIQNEGSMQSFRLQRTVNADVASLHGNPVAESVDNVRRQQEPFEMSLIQRFSPAGYQRLHEVKDCVPTGEALGVRRGKLVEEADSITVSGKWIRKHQGDGLGCSTDDRYAAKRIGKEGPSPVNIPFVGREVGVR